MRAPAGVRAHRQGVRPLGTAAGKWQPKTKFLLITARRRDHFARSGKRLLAVSLSASDPERTLSELFDTSVSSARVGSRCT